MLRFVSRTSIHLRLHLASTDVRAPRFIGRRKLAPRDWLALFIACGGAPDGLEPVRLQEGLFLFSQCPGVPPRSKYAFEPGIYGPVSNELYGDLDLLASHRLLRPVPVKGASWFRYKPNDATSEQARRILRRVQDADLLDAKRQLFEIKHYVSSVSFGELLDRVYAEHPEFATNSVFRRAA